LDSAPKLVRTAVWICGCGGGGGPGGGGVVDWTVIEGACVTVGTWMLISGGGMKGGGGAASFGGGGGGVSGGGFLISSMILVSIGGLITSMTLRARPLMSA
jgi:hypothetical protein